MTPEFVSRSFMIIRSSMIIFGMVVGMSISTNAETVKVMDEASTDGSFTIAQTNGAGAAGTPGRTAVRGRGRRRGQAPLQTAGTPEVAAELPRVAYQRSSRCGAMQANTGPCCVTVTHTPASAILGDSAHFGTLREGCHFSVVVHSNLDRMRRSCQCSVETPVPSDDMSGFCARRSDRFWRV